MRGGGAFGKGGRKKWEGGAKLKRWMHVSQERGKGQM